MKKRITVKSGLVAQLKARKRQRRFDFSKEFDLAHHHYFSGNMGEAEKIYRHILSVDPDNAVAYYALGITVSRLGRMEEAVQLTRRSIALDPSDPAAHDNLGILYVQLKRLSEAKHCFQRAIDLQQDNASAHFHMGNLLQEQGMFEQALLHYRKVLALQPEHAPAYSAQGNVYRRMSLFDAAEMSYRKALSCKPDYAEAYYNLGHLYKIHGSLAEAENHLKKAISIYPGYAEAHRSLSRIYRYTPDNEHIRKMEQLVSLPSLSLDQRMHLSFALGKAYEDIEDYDRSFSFLATANSLLRSTYTYSIDESNEFYAAIKKLFDGKKGGVHKAAKPDRPVPVFVLGMPRSGTTLVEQILASHDEVFGAGELPYLSKGILDITGTENVKEAVRSLEGSDLNILNTLGETYTEQIQQLSDGAGYIVDKMPYNFLLIGLIVSILPQAKIIHCVRNPADTCFSIFKNFFAGEHLYANELSELGEYYLLYQDLMKYWQEKYPGRIYSVQYERLVQNQEKEIRGLLECCALPWQENCLKFYMTKRAVATASAEQVRQPMYNKSIGSWRKYEKHLQPLCNILTSCGAA